MTVMPTTASWGRPFTVDDLDHLMVGAGRRVELIDGCLIVTGAPFVAEDLEHMPDDGRRYELIDGSLIVTPAPSARHQRGSLRLASLLDSACAPGMEVFTAPFDVRLPDTTEVQPDLLVAAKSQVDAKRLLGAPLLAVEILSGNTRLIDLALKKARYEEAGCPSYWVLDPDDESITVWELVEGHYEQRCVAVGSQQVDVTRPFVVSIVPALLFADRP